MNDTVFKLAIRTVTLLKTMLRDMPDAVQPRIVSYFGKAGGYIETIYGSQTGALETDSTDELCIEINNTLNRREKVYLLLLIQDCLLEMHNVQGFAEKLHYIYTCIGIDVGLLPKIKDFLEQDDLLTVNDRDYLLLSPYHEMDNEMLEGRWIENHIPTSNVSTSAFSSDQFKSHLLVMFVEQIKSYVVRCIEDETPLFDEDTVSPGRFRIIGPGNELCLHGVSVLSYLDLKSRFLQLAEKRELAFTIDHISYTNPRNVKEINTFSTNETTGRLIGIVGREGVGKSILLKLLAGKIKPDSGGIYINGYDLWKHKYLLKGVIGFVPEEDLLFEDLTVSDNLSLTARLYYSNLNKKEIDARVNTILSKLDLLELKHVVAGNVESKHIQPGQRRMINIALELLREPQILLVDNALSGLGMSDAAKVIKVLHDYSFAGNLVITSISQADAPTFMLFDKIWILDEGGYAVYNGTVKGAPGYLYRKLNMAEHDIDHIDPAHLLDLASYRLPDKKEHVWKRVLEPRDWHDHLLREEALHSNDKVTQSVLPARILKIPNLEIQLLIFSIRNFKCKFSRIHDVARTLITGPVIALLVATLFRFSSQGSYSLLTNPNIPTYLFISVIVAVFLGMIASMDEIVSERNILEKEQYLEFSRFSYLNSKIVYLFPVVAVELLLYVLTANLILELKELFWVHWIVLFSSACFGVLLGLVFSAGMYSSSFLHKGILPFIITVQILLGGGLIPYNQLNLGNSKFTPLLGDLMVSRWGYEALVVEQYKNNAFEKLNYSTDLKLDQAAFYTFQAIPRLEEEFDMCMTSTNEDSVRQGIILLQHELSKVAEIPDVFRFEYLKNLPEIRRNDSIAEETSGYLTYLRLHFYDQYKYWVQQKNLLIEGLADSIGTENLARLREDYHNLALEEKVIRNESEEEFTIIGNEIVRLKGMIYQNPRSDWGRAQLFSPVKLFNQQHTETLWFNISMIWLLVSLCYVYVLFDIGGFIRRLLHIEKYW